MEEIKLDHGSFAVGMTACMVASLAFGTMFVPIKKYDTRDGIYVQFIMGIAIECVAVAVNLFMECPPFYPLVMVGGALWAMGNVTAVPIVNMVGMSVGLLLWSTAGCVVGWAAGRFGFFNTIPQLPANDWLNISGIVLSILSAFMFAMVKSEVNDNRSSARNSRSNSPVTPGSQSAEDTRNLLANEERAIDDTSDDDLGIIRPSPPPIVQRGQALTNLLKFITGNSKQIGGISLSMLAGIFYGLCFVPVSYIQDHPELYPDAPKNGLSYAFAHMTGSFVMCTVFMLVYSAYSLNKPYIRPELTMPSFLTGLIWSMGQTAWFVANQQLSETVSFPIITRVPGVIASLWSIFYFREIRGKRNLLILSWAMLVAIIGSVLCGLSF